MKGTCDKTETGSSLMHSLENLHFKLVLTIKYCLNSGQKTSSITGSNTGVLLET